MATNKSLTIDFSDITPIEIPFTYKDENYVLCEATCDAAARYRHKLLASALLNEKGNPEGAKGLSEIEHLLVSSCVFVVRPDSRIPVNAELVQTWPSRMVGRLFQKAKQISELSNDDNEDEAKDPRKDGPNQNPTKGS